MAVKSQVLECFPSLLQCVKSEHTAVRHMAARALAASAYSLTVDMMNLVLEEILPLLRATHEVNWRQGAIETTYRILGLSIIV